MTIALSEVDSVKKWLEKFDDGEYELVSALIDELLLISRDDFAYGMQSMLDDIVGGQGVSTKKIALYAEQPIKKVFGKIPTFFKNSRKGRAEGMGKAPIIVDPRDQEVGSEGVIANIITDYCRRNTQVCFSHPGPKKMRKEKVRQIVIITDFIGSGKRIRTMLESFGHVATLRSWRSYKLLRFVVLTYSGTDEGMSSVRTHMLQPDVYSFTGCPTIRNTFFGNQRAKIESLCRTYPKNHSEPLGFRAGASLIAFAHGCPNNAPPILHSRKSKWAPLFCGRSTTNASAAFKRINNYDALDQSAKNLLGIRKARNKLNFNSEWIKAMKVLAASKSGARTPNEFSARTHIEVSTIDQLIQLSIEARWLNQQNRLTKLGARELIRGC